MGGRIIINCKFADFEEARVDLFVHVQTVVFDEKKKGGELIV